MTVRAAVLALAVFAAPPAFAQALGSVHCKASLRQSGIDLKATQRKLDSVQNGSAADKCGAMRVHIIMLERASVIFGRCTEGAERDENVGRTDGSAAEVRAEMARSCGG